MHEGIAGLVKPQAHVIGLGAFYAADDGRYVVIVYRVRAQIVWIATIRSRSIDEHTDGERSGGQRLIDIERVGARSTCTRCRAILVGTRVSVADCGAGSDAGRSTSQISSRNDVAASPIHRDGHLGARRVGGDRGGPRLWLHVTGVQRIGTSAHRTIYIVARGRGDRIPLNSVVTGVRLIVARIGIIAAALGDDPDILGLVSTPSPATNRENPGAAAENLAA